jgi:hypothetical protein
MDAQRSALSFHLDEVSVVGPEHPETPTKVSIKSSERLATTVLVERIKSGVLQLQP